jgi:hypothetical protein
MDRRRFIGAAAGSLITVSSTVKAQQAGHVRRIGWVWNQAPLTADQLHLPMRRPFLSSFGVAQG